MIYEILEIQIYSCQCKVTIRERLTKFETAVKLAMATLNHPQHG